MRNLTSYQISEWIAFAGLEPFGDLQADFRAGQIAATIANVNRGMDSETFQASDFFHSLASPTVEKESGPILLIDPEAQARLIKATIFGIT